MTGWRNWFKRLAGGGAAALLAVLLAAVIMVPEAKAVTDMQAALNQVVDWGVMRGDIAGNLNENNDITRAEFATMINRAFGYARTGEIPFTDVENTDWYADDVSIAYQIGYMEGTSASLFSPMASITREEAAVILARVLAMQPEVGENTQFSDSRSMGNWSRGYITAIADAGVMNGYPDGRFGPQDNLTRGQAALLLTNALGTPLLEAGDYSLGSVWGNVTITASGTTLRDTVVGGNLYITAGVDLGHVTLENVTVLGEIIICGGGASEGGEDSIVLRNVSAPKMIVDNIGNQPLSVKTEGDGVIDEAFIRTDAYVEDNTADGYGISKITMDGEEGLSLTVAGNIKEVLNTVPNSSLSLASGQAHTITVDESAVGSTLHIAGGSRVENVNLDTGVEVSGTGDIDKLTVNANGSTVPMLPDQITIRPGITANINGEEMDSAAAAESSADPRLYAGYPKIKDLAPTTATAVFSANKKGTVYWALTAVTDGSVSVDELINPSAYQPKVVLSGTVALTGSGQEGTAALSKLTSDGSYYLSTVFVDARGERSPLKVISFTTPDDSKPDFAKGYPYMSKITNISAQVTVMPTKTCRLYWAVLPKGSTAPTANDFKANAVTGNLGFGSMDVTKNTAYSFDVNNVPLAELESYELYLWLTDVDNGQSSAVKKLDFTTVDKTPPVFNTEPTVNKVEKNSVGLYANLNENGTLYWVVVAQGEEYPKPLAGQSGAVDLSSENAKIQVMNGMNALKSGKTNMTEDKDVSFNVSGLDPEKAYDLYYVAQDKAGNFSARVGKLTIHTADPNAPTVTQEFSRYSGEDASTPYADTDVTLVFSETIQDDETNQDMVQLYDDISKATGDEKVELQQRMAEILRKNITLYYHSNVGRPEAVTEDTAAEHWINFENAVIKFDDNTGTTRITFNHGTGIQLLSGATYHFEVSGFADMSTEKNVMTLAKLPEFVTLFAQISITDGKDSPENIYKSQAVSGREDTTIDTVFTENGSEVSVLPVDFYWQLEPISASQVDDSIKWDMIIWTDTRVEFKLFRRGPDDGGKWTYLGTGVVPVTSNTPKLGISLQMDIVDPTTNNPIFPQLNSLKDEQIYEYAISISKLQDSSDRDTWSQTVTANINTVAGRNNPLGLLCNSITEQTWNQLVGVGKDVLNIGIPSEKELSKPFRDQQAPYFISGYPTITAGDSTAQIDVMLDRTGTVFWVVAERNLVNTIGADSNNTDYGKVNIPNTDPSQPGLPYGDLPRSGLEDGLNDDTGEKDDSDGAGISFISMKDPTNTMISDPVRWVTNEDIQYGSASAGSASRPIKIENLDANKDYIVYFVIQGTSNVFSEVMCYRFTTGDVTPAYITLDTLSNPKVGMKVSQNAGELYYALYAPSSLPETSLGDMDKVLLNQCKATDLTAEEEAEFISKYATNSILQAMLTTYKADGESVFDRFANEEIKKEVYEILSAQGGTGSLAGGQLSDMKMGERELVDFEQAMDPNSITQYICIATAQNELGGEWTFKAINGVRIPDGIAPYLVEIISPNATEMGGGNKGLYQGTLTLRFNETLYYTDGQYDSTGVSFENIWSVVHEDIAPGADPNNVGFINICSITGQYAQLRYKSNSTTKEQTFELSFQGFAIGDSITIPRSGALTDLEENTNTSHAYTLQLVEVKGEGGGLIPNFQGDGARFILVSGELGPQ